MSSMTNVRPRPYLAVPGYAYWLNPVGFEKEEGFFPLLLQTIQCPYVVEHPKIGTWLTLLYTAYGSKLLPILLSIGITTGLILSFDVPIPLNTMIGFLAGWNATSNNWRYVVPGIAKIYGFDTYQNNIRTESTQDIQSNMVNSGGFVGLGVFLGFLAHTFKFKIN